MKPFRALPPSLAVWGSALWIMLTWCTAVAHETGEYHRHPPTDPGSTARVADGTHSEHQHFILHISETKFDRETGNEATVYSSQVRLELNEPFFYKTRIGGVQVTLEGWVEQEDDDYHINVKQTRQTRRDADAAGAPGTAIFDEQSVTLAVHADLEEEIKISDEEAQIVATPSGNATPSVRCETFYHYLKLEPAPERASASHQPDVASTAAGREPGTALKENEEGPRTSGPRLISLGPHRQYLVEFRPAPLKDEPVWFAGFAPRIVLTGDRTGGAIFEGSDGTLSVLAQVRSEHDGAMEFYTTWTSERRTTKSIAEEGEKTQRSRETLRRETTLRAGEEKEVGELGGAKIFVKVTPLAP
ncbi:MAG: hypothetical protein Kow0059_08690 [Candidatus Sumerlaeia bacterium]